MNSISFAGVPNTAKLYSGIHISIYISKANDETGSYKSRNRVKYCMSLRKIEKKLLDKGISFIMVREMLKPLENIVESNIWARKCKGVAIFSKGDKVTVYACNKAMQQQEIVAESFYTDPLQDEPTINFANVKETLSILSSPKPEHPEYPSYYS